MVEAYEVPWALSSVSIAQRSEPTQPIRAIWMVFHDSGPDDKIIAVLDDEAEAHALWERLGPSYDHGTLMTPFEVPWQAPDPTQIIIA